MSNSPIPRRNILYGYPNPNTALFPEPIRSASAPNIYDFQEIGTEWVNTTTGDLYFLVAITNGQAIWAKVIVSGGSATFSSLTVNPGPTLLDGQVTIVAGNHPVHISTTDNVASAISLTTNGGTSETITVTNTQGTSSGAINLYSIVGGVEIEGGLATASAIVLNATNAAGGVSIDTGSAGLIVASVNGPIDLNSETGAINISTDAHATTIDIGTGAGAKSVLIGSTNTTSETQIQGGSLGITLVTGTTTATAGNIAITPSAQTIPSPTATITENTRLISGIFTGFTTASAGTQVFTVSSTEILTTSAVLAFVTNLNASTNGATMAITGTIQAAGSLAITCTNTSGAALGAGDHILLTVWVLS